MQKSSDAPSPIETDLFTLGAGLAGLSAAILLARDGFSVTLVDRAAPVLDAADPASDLRTTALLGPSIELLEEIGVWSRLEGRTAPLRAMRLIEAGGAENRARDRAAFEAGELDRPMFGANVANTDLKAALWAQAQQTEGLRLIAPARLDQLLLREDAAITRLSTGHTVRARLAIGADGRESAVRAAAGLSVYRYDYDQAAMAFVVSHDAPHGEASIEILREGGPFTLVPFTPDPQTGRSRSSVVWMESRARTARLMALGEAEFEDALNERSLDELGPLRLVSRRAAWPMTSMIASRFHARRAALIAEAAHVVPPIGAQGLNMSLADARALAKILTEARAAGRDIGAASVLERLTRARYGDVAGRVAATAALNGVAIGALQPIRDLRRTGLALVHGLAPLKRAAMRFGLG